MKTVANIQRTLVSGVAALALTMVISVTFVESETARWAAAVRPAHSGASSAHATDTRLAGVRDAVLLQ